MKENQNTGGQPRGVIPLEAQQTSEYVTPETSGPGLDEVKEEPQLIPQTETENSKPETDPMEVHKHPHHVMHKKKWTEYLLEFFMLFLAVFLGFLAENFREHEVEKEREKQYMQSLVYDLQSDTLSLNAGFAIKDQRIAAIDSVFLFYETHAFNTTKVPGALYRQIRRTMWDRIYRRNSTTIDQLKNAGGMRLIRKRVVADSIAAYDWKWQRAEFWRESYSVNQDKEDEMANKIVNAKSLLHAYRTNATQTTLSPEATDTLDISINPDGISEYLNYIYRQKIHTRQDKAGYQEIEKSAERLIELIKKEYKLD
ncbi:MAG: hypothetical protein ACXVBJ_11305 [Flavisolibacter sp.]